MKAAFISQYRAGLKMLANAIEKCPDDLWDNQAYGNSYWRIAYHALFYTAFYLSENSGSFDPWGKHSVNYHVLGAADDNGNVIIIDHVYSKEELLAYAQAISDEVDEAVNITNGGDESGFDWIPMDKFELHLYNIRHSQHHTGQLTERLHQNGITGIDWVGRMK